MSMTNARSKNTINAQSSAVEYVDFIDQESGELVAMLLALAVSCECMAGVDEARTGICETDIRRGVAGMARLLEHLADRTGVIKAAVDAMFQTIRPALEGAVTEPRRTLKVGARKEIAA
jgi:hypothetical protein